ncbi:MAG TPA: hypothetical protein VF447_05335 [Terriglobales bacterium]
MANLSYTFEELPLVIAGGIPAGLINGQAEITYSRDGDWAVSSITLEGFGERVNGVRQWPQVSAPAPIVTIVCDRLNNEWHSKVQDAVNEAISEDRQCAADDYADMRREERAMERV